MKCGGLDHVVLDISHKPKAFITSHFPKYLRTLSAVRLRHGTRADIRRANRPLYLRGDRYGSQRSERSRRAACHRRVRFYRATWRQSVGKQFTLGVHGGCSLGSASLSNQLQRAVAAPATLPPWDESRVGDSDEQVVVSHKYYSPLWVTNNLLELRNLVLIAELITRCALARHESRGLHFTRDYPQVDPHTAGRDTVLSPPSFEQLDAPANA